MIFLLALQHVVSSHSPSERDERGLSTASVWGCFSATSWALC